MSLLTIVITSLVVMGVYLMVVEYLIRKQSKEIKYLKTTLHHLLLILEAEGTIILKEVGDDE